MTQQTAAAPLVAAPAAAPGIYDLRTVDAGLAVPRTLARWRLAVATTVLAGAVLSALVLVLGWQANREAAADARQLVRVQGIKADLLRADALATNAFLRAGLELPAQREAYDQALDAVTRAMTDAAQAQPADRAVLSELGSRVLRYAGLVEQARATNRQGLPVGAAYLRTASGELRTQVMPLVEQLVTYDKRRAEDHMGGRFPLLVLLPGLLTLAVLVLAHRWVAQRFHRRWNSGLLGAAALVLVGVLAAAGVEWSAASANSTLRTTAYADLVRGAADRAAANDAKANESLRLVARGSGQPFEDAWQANATLVGGNVSGTTLAGPWKAYTARHAEVVRLDTAGQWEKAVAEATSSAAGASGATFTAFDEAVSAQVSASAHATDGALGDRSLLSLVVLAGVLLVGGVAASASWRGLSRRLAEYEL